MANNYDIDDVVRLTAAFTSGGVATDPTTVTLKVQDPSGNEATYTYALAEITRTAVGAYRYDLPVDEAGIWYFRWKGTGACISAGEGRFYVRRSEF